MSKQITYAHSIMKAFSYHQQAYIEVHGVSEVRLLTIHAVIVGRLSCIACQTTYSLKPTFYEYATKSPHSAYTPDFNYKYTNL